MFNFLLWMHLYHDTVRRGGLPGDTLHTILFGRVYLVTARGTLSAGEMDFPENRGEDLHSPCTSARLA